MKEEELPRTLLRASWGAIGLGLLLEGLQLATTQALGGAVPAGAAIFAETVQKLSWSWMVCAALACGMVAGRQAPRVVGLVGLFAAPISFGVAKAVHKSVAAAVGSAVPAGGPSPMNHAAPGGLPTASMAARAINELLFPVGCACVLWTTSALTRRPA